MWLDSNGNSYAPGASVPADVTELTVQWTAPTYTVTLNAGDGTINSGNVTSYTYGVGATLPTDVTRTGYTFKGWYDNENLTGLSCYGNRRHRNGQQGILGEVGNQSIYRHSQARKRRSGYYHNAGLRHTDYRSDPDKRGLSVQRLG